MKTFFILFILGVIFASSIFSVNDAFAASFIKFDGIDGESKDKDHKGWSDLVSFLQVTTREDSSTARTDVKISEVVIVKELDKASPKLAESVAKGAVIPKVDVYLNSDDGTFLRYELTNVMITSYSMSGTTDERPLEEITSSYEKIMQYDEPIKSSEADLVAEKPEIVEESAVTEESIDSEQPRVPNWVQTTATFWVDGNVSDREFTDGIGYLVKEKIIELDEKVESGVGEEPTEPEVPTWIKDSTKWWIDGLVPEDQFLESIKWLIKNNIIRGVSN